MIKQTKFVIKPINIIIGIESKNIDLIRKTIVYGNTGQIQVPHSSTLQKPPYTYLQTPVAIQKSVNYRFHL